MDNLVHIAVTNVLREVMFDLYNTLMQKEESFGKIIKIEDGLIQDKEYFEQRVLLCLYHELHHVFGVREEDLTELFKFKFNYIKGE